MALHHWKHNTLPILWEVRHYSAPNTQEHRRQWFIVSWEEDTRSCLSTQPPFLFNCILRRKGSRHLSHHKTVANLLLDALYMLFHWFLQKLCAVDDNVFDRCSNWNPEQLKRWLQASVGLFKGRIHPQFVCVPRDCASNHTSLPPGKSRGKHFPALPCI